MLTSTLISLIRKEVGTHMSRTEILEMLNVVQNEIYSHDCAWTRIKPDPVITTTDGTYEYTASTALKESTSGTIGSAIYDVRRVERVYTYRNRLDPFNTFGGAEISTYLPDRTGFGERGYVTINRITAVDSVKVNSSDAKIIFHRQNNPGTTGVTSIQFLARAYKWPTQLLAEATAMSLPEHAQMSLLRPGVLRYLDQWVYGRDIDYGSIYEKELRKFLSWSGSAAQATEPPYTPFRDF